MRRSTGVAIVLAVVAGSISPLLSPARAATPGTLTTYAGGMGFGTATDVAQSPVGIGVVGDRVLTVDGISSATGVPPLGVSYPMVVRSLDLRTGVQSVVAGSDVGGVSGDGPAVGAPLSGGKPTVGDAQGNVYVPDSGSHRIRKISPSGIITTVAGTGTRGFSGDGGPATEAELSTPWGITLAPDGSTVFSDTGNGRVRRIGPDGMISTIAGDGTSGTGGDGGPAVDAQLESPRDLGFDSYGNLYIADALGDRIRKVTPEGVITTLAVTGFPRGMAVAGDGRVLVTYGSTIRRFDQSGTFTVLAGSDQHTAGFSGDGGPATAAQLNDPRGVAIDTAGNVYIADSGNARVRVVDTTGVIRTIAGNGSTVFSGEGGPAVGARLGSPGLVRTGPHGTYIADRGNDRVHHVDPAGVIRTVRESRVHGMALDRAGNLYLSENSRVVKRAPDGTVTVIADREGTDLSPGPLAIDGNGSLYVADQWGGSTGYSFVHRIDPDGVVSLVAGTEPGKSSQPVPPGPALHTPMRVHDMAVGSDGTLHVMTGGSLLRISCGIVTRPAIEPFDWDQAAAGPQGMAVDRAGNVFVTAGGKVRRVAPDGRVTTVAGGGTAVVHDGRRATDVGLDRATGSIALDDTGNLYVANAGRVLKVAGVSAGAAVPGLPCPPSADLTWPPPLPPEGSYNPVAPARLLDTRYGTGGFSSAVGPGGTIALGVTGVGGVPATGVSAVALNVTVTQPTAVGYLSVFPSRTARPNASSVNFVPNQTVANVVVAKVGPDGKISIYNASGSTHVVVDVTGWFGAEGSHYNPHFPTRLLDTRYAAYGQPPIGPDGTISVNVTGFGGVPGTGAAAVVLNVTVTEPTAVGYVSAFPSGTSRPTTSSVNFVPDQTVANLVVAKVGDNGRVNIYNASGTTHVIVDVVGWYGTGWGSRYTGLAPARLLDTRSGTGGFSAPVGPNGAVALGVSGVGGVPPIGVSSVVLNVTVTQPTAVGYLTVYASGTPRPSTSSVNFVPTETVANLVVARMGEDGKVSIFNASGLTHVVVDVVGWYGPASP